MASLPAAALSPWLWAGVRHCAMAPERVVMRHAAGSPASRRIPTCCASPTTCECAHPQPGRTRPAASQGAAEHLRAADPLIVPSRAARRAEAGVLLQLRGRRITRLRRLLGRGSLGATSSRNAFSRSASPTPMTSAYDFGSFGSTTFAIDVASPHGSPVCPDL